MAPRAKKQKIVLHAAPDKIRRVWKMKPLTHVQENRRKAKLNRLRDKENRDPGD